VEDDVVIGNRVTIKSGVFLWNGITLGDDVFVGPNATFSNDSFPRSKIFLSEPVRTVVEDGASIGANATILPGCRIGRQAMVGAGAVVTRDVPAFAVVTGNPAHVTRYLGGHESDEFVPEAAFQLPSFVDDRGHLAVLDDSSIPFQPRRVFLVYDVPDRRVRGEHAHRECHQFLVCPHGSVRVQMDDGRRRWGVTLSSPNEGLHVAPMVWSTQYQFAPGTVLVVLASHPYDSNDYIRSYDEFRRIAGASVRD
jgi:UDP-2-acetamido-3-amino-2,3-dideoxy-glucuronate N-acetyltransferase